MKKLVTITFDYEGTWGMIHKDAPYDLAAVTRELLDLLDRHQAKAVFFTVGKLFEEYPEVIKEIHARGHEIGLHGYIHEHLHDLDAAALAEFKARLALTNDNLKRLIGKSPAGFRAPYLMGPKFYIPANYQTLADAGYRWISNHEIRLPEELFRPDRLPFGASLLRIRPLRQLALLVLNPGLLGRSHRNTGLASSPIRWLLGGQDPFRRPEGLIEYPLTSPLDCDLVGLPRPEAHSGQNFIDYASRVIIDSYERSGEYFNINSHDWVIGTADRIQILDHALAHISADPNSVYYLPGKETANEA